MEVKKSPQADLEGKKTTNLLIGAIMILAVLFVGFEWSERDKKVMTDSGIQEVMFEEEIIPITEQEQPQQAPPPPQAPPAEEVLEIIENDSKVEESTIQASDDTNAAVEVKYTPVEVEEEEVDEQEIFTIVEEMPEYPGGIAAAMKWIANELKYPAIAQENGVQGRVTVRFTINADGSVVDPVVVRGVDPHLDKEALRVIGKMPKWKPGKQRGKAVRVSYNLPVRFKLN
jgi:protein TonB